MTAIQHEKFSYLKCLWGHWRKYRNRLRAENYLFVINQVDKKIRNDIEYLNTIIKMVDLVSMYHTRTLEREKMCPFILSIKSAQNFTTYYTTNKISINSPE